MTTSPDGAGTGDLGSHNLDVPIMDRHRIPPSGADRPACPHQARGLQPARGTRLRPRRTASITQHLGRRSSRARPTRLLKPVDPRTDTKHVPWLSDRRVRPQSGSTLWPQAVTPVGHPVECHARIVRFVASWTGQAELFRPPSGAPSRCGQRVRWPSRALWPGFSGSLPPDRGGA